MLILDFKGQRTESSRHVRGLARLARRLGGAVLLGVGVVLMILPGPGIPFVIAGLVLLEWDVPSARWLRARLVELVPRRWRSA